jgi:multiple sugar transport system substrate-binding protein
MDKGVIQGKQYTLPYLCGNPRILYCNMDILNAAGVNETPKTWEEFLNTAEKIKETQPDKSPYLAEWANPSIGGMNNCFYPFLWQAGGAVFNEEGHISLDTPEALKTAQFIYDMKHNGILPDKATSMNAEDVKNAFLEGDVGMVIQACTIAPEVDAAGINWDFTPSLEEKTKGTFIGADGLVIMNDSDKKELAAEVIKVMTSAPVMEEFHKNLLKQPPITKSEKSYDDERFTEMYETELDAFQVLPVVEGSFKVYDSLYKNLQLMLQDQLTPEQALQDTITYAETIQE